MPQGHNAETAEVFKMLGQEGTWRATQVCLSSPQI